MKIEIYEAADPVEEEPLRLRLKKHGEVAVLVAVNAQGLKMSEGNLLEISSEGFRCCANVNTRIRLPRDAQGKIKLVS